MTENSDMRSVKVETEVTQQAFQDIVDAGFSNLTESIHNQSILDEASTDKVISALQKSEPFERLVVETLATFSIPREHFNMLGTMIGYFVLAGYSIRAGEYATSVLKQFVS